MPVILGQGRGMRLTPENAAVEALKGMLVPCAADGMVAYSVSAAVNRAGVEGDGLIAPGLATDRGDGDTSDAYFHISSIAACLYCIQKRSRDA